MKRNITLLLWCMVLFGSFSSCVFAEEAQKQMTLLSPQIPLVDVSKIMPGTTGGLVDVVNAFFAIAIVISAILAVIMIAIGGFRYMTTDSVFAMGDAKGQITDAIIGLLIVLMAILILATINPDLVKLKLFDSNDYFGGQSPTPATNATTASNSNTATTPTGSQTSGSPATQTGQNTGANTSGTPPMNAPATPVAPTNQPATTPPSSTPTNSGTQTSLPNTSPPLLPTLPSPQML